MIFPRISLHAIVSVSLIFFVSSFNNARANCPEGFCPLFNGKDLTGWKGLVGNLKLRAAMSPEELAKAQTEADARMKTHWKVVDGVIEFDGNKEKNCSDNLCTEKEYRDFELYVDWKISATGDSGIYLRGCPQVQIWDTNFEKYKPLKNFKGSGNLYNNEKSQRHALVRADNPVGEWNTFYIRLIEDRILVKLNGKVVTENIVMENFWERDKPLYRTGSIELQNHSSLLWFKNIYLREIPEQEADDILGRLTR